MKQVSAQPPAGWDYRRCFFCSRMTVAIRSPDDARTTAQHLRREIASFAPELGTPEVTSILAEQMSTFGPGGLTRHMRLVGGFGIITAALALLGIVGMVNDGMARRTREIGIRSALGARPNQIVLTVTRPSLRTAAIGTAAGSAFTLLGSSRTRRIFYFGVSDSALPATLYGTGPTDLTVVLPVAAVLLLLAVAAALFSAARLVRLDPGVTLRPE
jgi:putative ABC transport system permease protein